MRQSDPFGLGVAGILFLSYWLAVILLTYVLVGPSELLALEAAGAPLTVLLFAYARRNLVRNARAIAYRDELTGLPNRTYFMERLEEAMGRATRSDKLVAVLFIDLDRFKVHNDTLGHDAGDKLLVEASKRLQRQVRSGEVIARLGGDEFTIVAEGMRDQIAAEALAARILLSMEVPFSVNGHDVKTSASIGIALNVGSHCPPEELVRRADVALYEAKADGRARYKVFKGAGSTRSLERPIQDAGLRKAIEENELCLYFQPLIHLASGEIDGFESLVRWQHPERGLLLPDAFIGTAQEGGLMRAVGKWVLEQSCEQAVAWQHHFPHRSPLRLHVNLTPGEFRERDLVHEVAEVLRLTGLDPSLLTLEIVETALMSDSEVTLSTLRDFRRLGVKLAIDDFGTGYSSLSYLRKFPIDALKIDQSFVRELAQDNRVTSIIESVITLAHALDIEVTAEGVETHYQLAFLMNNKCDLAQGYLFARPLPEEAVIPYLEAAGQNTLANSGAA